MTSWVKNKNQELGKKMKKGKEKKGKIIFKKVEKCLKNASFWAIYSRKGEGG